MWYGHGYGCVRRGERESERIKTKIKHPQCDSTFIHILNEWLWCVDLFYSKKPARSFLRNAMKLFFGVNWYRENANEKGLWMSVARQNDENALKGWWLKESNSGETSTFILCLIFNSSEGTVHKRIPKKINRKIQIVQLLFKLSKILKKLKS